MLVNIYCLSNTVIFIIENILIILIDSFVVIQFKFGSINQSTVGTIYNLVMITKTKPNESFQA